MLGYSPHRILHGLHIQEVVEDSIPTGWRENVALERNWVGGSDVHPYDHQFVGVA